MNPIPPDLLGKAIEFHGHLGPFMVLGLRVGWLVRDRLRASPFEISAEVGCPLTPPGSCFIDGIQVGSGCTTGKANLRHRNDSRIWAHFAGPNGDVRFRISDRGLKQITRALRREKTTDEICAEIASGSLDNLLFSTEG